MKINQKGVIQILFLVVLALALTAGIVYFAFKKDQVRLGSSNLNQLPTLSPTQPASPQSPVKSGDFDNWKTYSNNKEGFSFKYPPDIDLQTENNTVGIIGPDNTIISFEIINGDGTSASEWWKKNSYAFSGAPKDCYSVETTRDVYDPKNPGNKIAGFAEDVLVISVSSNEEKCNGPFGDSLIIVPHAKQIFKIVWSHSRLSDQILSTFRLFDPGSGGLIPADSNTPAAGACDTVTGKTVIVSLNIDVPYPRCVKISADQRLSLINNTDKTVFLDFDRFHDEIPSEKSYTFPDPASKFLQSGVHVITTSLYDGSGPEVWAQYNSSTDNSCTEGEVLKECKTGPCCCPKGAICD